MAHLDTHATLRLTEQLLSMPSPTPSDGGCQALMAARLAPLGFVCETIESGPADFRVTNLWAKRAATLSAAKAPKTLVFAGHTDVVPTGPLAQWDSPPFSPSHRDGKLYGRGASDMKTSLAAFVVAIEEFVAQQPDAALNIALLITSDEEGPAVDGTVVVCQQLQARITLLPSDGLDAPALQALGPFDLLLCNPPYVNADSMAALPPEFRAEPALALDGNADGGRDGMDFVRRLLRDATQHLHPQGVLVLEIGHERAFFEAAFPALAAVWLPTSAGEDQVLLLTRESLLA